MQAYIKFLVFGKYKFGFGLAAAFLFMAFFPLRYLVKQYTWLGHDLEKVKWIADIAEYWPFLSLWVMIPGFVVALFWAVWFGYKLLNDEMKKRDAEDLKRSPEMRVDRAYRLIHKLIEEGDMLINHNAHVEAIEKWDERVQRTLADWCDIGAIQIYLHSTRKLQETKLEDHQMALDRLKYIHKQLEIFII